MSNTLTVRTDKALDDALRERAKAQGKSVSQVVREILRSALDERSVEARVGHLRGRLELSPGPSDAWQRQLRERNWRS